MNGTMTVEMEVEEAGNSSSDERARRAFEMDAREDEFRYLVQYKHWKNRDYNGRED